MTTEASVENLNAYQSEPEIATHHEARFPGSERSCPSRQDRSPDCRIHGCGQSVAEATRVRGPATSLGFQETEMSSGVIAAPFPSVFQGGVARSAGVVSKRSRSH